MEEAVNTGDIGYRPGRGFSEAATLKNTSCWNTPTSQHELEARSISFLNQGKEGSRKAKAKGAFNSIETARISSMQIEGKGTGRGQVCLLHPKKQHLVTAWHQYQLLDCSLSLSVRNSKTYNSSHFSVIGYISLKYRVFLCHQKDSRINK